MNKIEQIFGKKKVLLPVIHVKDQLQTIIQIGEANLAGCNGVFLINHRIRHTKLFSMIPQIRKIYPYIWIGVNPLDLSPLKAIEKIPIGVNGLWVDDSYIEDDKPLTEAIQMWNRINELNILYFGGVAFKHQKPVTQLELRCKDAKNLMDVVTTSGDDTGVSPYIGKIACMKKYIGDKPLAVASGITSDNVNDYLPYVDVFLTSTGISKSFTELCPDKVKDLNQKIENYD